MSGIYISGMEMPTSCMLCSFCVEEADPANGEMCMVTGTLMPPCTRERLDNCPLAPVPPHGRLIDADALITTFCEWGTRLERSRKLVITMCEAKQAIVDIIEDATTIIEAEEGE